MKSYFAYFQPTSIRKPLKQSKIIRWNYYCISLGLNGILQIAHSDTLPMLAKTKVNQVSWMKYNALP